METINTWNIGKPNNIIRTGGAMYSNYRAVTQKSKATGLSKRERQILQLVANGLSSKHIATELSICVDTVETHRKGIYKKIKVNNAAEATAFGFRNRLIK
jgi:DNA-binding NarL/FixJ family response regulator